MRLQTNNNNMASPFTRLEEDLTCPVCIDIFTDPVVLPCSHSFCKLCLQEWWAERSAQDCPVCKKRTKKSKNSQPPTNLVLKNLCEKFLEEKRLQSAAPEVAPEVLCAAHGEKLRLFCQEDERPACLVCRDSEKHAGHRFSPVDEASGRCKEKVRESLKPLREKLEVLNEVKANYHLTENHIKVQAQNTEPRIKAQFAAFHRFLQEEEEARISAIREEEARKSRDMKERIEKLNAEIATVSDAIRAAEDQLSADDHVSFLENYRSTMERVRLTPQYPQPWVSGALIDEGKHLDNLAFRVWEKMKDALVSYTPVVLDPNTAYPEFVLSDDLTGVRLDVCKAQQLPDNPERFDWSDIVLGSEGFGSGTTRSWDVEVGDNPCWSLGVVAESYQRKGEAAGGESWATTRGLAGFSAVHSSGSAGDVPTVLYVRRKPRRVRVRLDWSGGTLSFSDPDTGAHLHTFSHAFTERLFPFVSIFSHNMSLKMLPAKICVTLDTS